MDRFVKIKQYKNLCLVFIALLVIVILITCVVGNKKKIHFLGPYYEKNVTTGIDSLNEKELWIEKSTNELNELRKKNELLEGKLTIAEKELSFVKKLAVNNLKPQELSTNKEEVNENTEDKVEKHQYNMSVEKIEDFIKSDKAVNDVVRSYSNLKLTNGKIKVFNFANVETEHNLDENFIFASTSAKCILLGSVTVSAGVNASANPQPVMLQIIDAGDLPNNVKSFLQGARVIGAAYGELSSESIVIRLERLVKIDKAYGVGIDIPVKGYVTSEYGNTRIKGTVYDKAGSIVRSAAIAGFLSGTSSFISSYSNSGIKFEPNSGLAQFSPQTGAKLLEQGASKGIGNAVEKYADFIIKRAEQMQPVIKIDGGREFEIVFTESVKASVVHMKKVRRRLYDNTK